MAATCLSWKRTTQTNGVIMDETGSGSTHVSSSNNCSHLKATAIVLSSSLYNKSASSSSSLARESTVIVVADIVFHVKIPSSFSYLHVIHKSHCRRHDQSQQSARPSLQLVLYSSLAVRSSRIWKYARRVDLSPPFLRVVHHVGYLWYHCEHNRRDRSHDRHWWRSHTDNDDVDVVNP